MKPHLMFAALVAALTLGLGAHAYADGRACATGHTHSQSMNQACTPHSWLMKEATGKTNPQQDAAFREDPDTTPATAMVVELEQKPAPAHMDAAMQPADQQLALRGGPHERPSARFTLPRQDAPEVRTLVAAHHPDEEVKLAHSFFTGALNGGVGEHSFAYVGGRGIVVIKRGSFRYSAAARSPIPIVIRSGGHSGGHGGGCGGCH